MLSTSTNIFSKSWSKFNERFYIQSSSPKAVTKQQQKLQQQHKKNTFSQDIRRGLTSDTFDLASNNREGDSRPGIDGDRIEEIMEASGCSFDEARWLFFCMQCFENNIDPISGLPMDPKAVHAI